MDKSELETILDGVVIDQELFESDIIQILGLEVLYISTIT